jgi:hypothetical protein
LQRERTQCPFRRELEYDLAGYDVNESQDKRDRIFLLVSGEPWEQERYAVGAIVFRWMEYSNAPHQLVLAWIWIHPFLRQKGIFTTYWNIFRELHGDFYVEKPYSRGMKAFLAKMGAAYHDIERLFVSFDTLLCEVFP